MTCTWILICTNLVPISLNLSLELVKLWQGMFIEFDWKMVDGASTRDEKERYLDPVYTRA